MEQTKRFRLNIDDNNEVKDINIIEEEENE